MHLWEDNELLLLDDRWILRLLEHILDVVLSKTVLKLGAVQLVQLISEHLDAMVILLLKARWESQ